MAGKSADSAESDLPQDEMKKGAAPALLFLNARKPFPNQGLYQLSGIDGAF